jgi:hypothetical protein
MNDAVHEARIVSNQFLVVLYEVGKVLDSVINQVKAPSSDGAFTLADPTGLEPAISSVTGRRDNHFTTSPYLLASGWNVK